jgi:hypothetical protein
MELQTPEENSLFEISAAAPFRGSMINGRSEKMCGQPEPLFVGAPEGRPRSD